MSPSLNIVSSSHLVSERSAELSEFEFGLMVVSNAFKEALNKSTSDQRRANPPTPIRQWGFGE